MKLIALLLIAGAAAETCQHVSCVRNAANQLVIKHRNSIKHGLAHHGPLIKPASCNDDFDGACSSSRPMEHSCSYNEEANECQCTCSFPPVNCIVGDWEMSGTCTKQCGGGSQAYTRQVLTAAAYGGTPCPELEKSEACNEQPCP